MFRQQAGNFEALGSPVYARLAERLARGPEPARRFFPDEPDFHDPWPGPPRLAAHLDFHGNWMKWLL